MSFAFSIIFEAWYLVFLHDLCIDSILAISRFNLISSRMRGFPEAAAFISAALADSLSVSSIIPPHSISPARNCSTTFALSSIICQRLVSSVSFVEYLYISTSNSGPPLFNDSMKKSLPWRMILPSLCSRSAGLHGASRWWSATSLFCTFMPAPILAVDPISILTCPDLTFPNNSYFWSSVFASCMKAISFSGIPLLMSFCFISS